MNNNTDLRLEAVAKAWYAHGAECAFGPGERVRQFIAMYDTIRAFDQAEPHTVTSVTGYPIEDKPGPNNETAPVMGADPGLWDPKTNPTGQSGVYRDLQRRRRQADQGADPPWFRDCIAAAHRAWLDTGASKEIINWHAIVRAALAFANAQPPSDEAIRIGEGAFLEVWPGHLALPPEWRGCVRAALVKARSGVTSKMPRADYLIAQGVHTISPPADENRPKPEPIS